MNRKLPRLTLPFALAAMVTLLAGCATGPRIFTNTDPAADIGSFRTYNFVQPLGTDRAGYSSLESQFLRTAVNRELSARGFQLSDNPDMLVNFYIESRERLQATTTSAPGFGGFYGFRRYGVWGGYETRITQFTEDTLIVDLVDARRSQLVWEGIAVDRVREQDLRNRQNSFDRAVAQIFAEFPWRAAGSMARASVAGETR